MYRSSDNSFDNSFSPTPNAEDAGRGAPASCYAPPDLLEQTYRDGLSLPAISVALRRWALQQEDVAKVAVGYIGAQYSVAILFSEFQVGRISGLYTELDHILSKFGKSTVLLYPLGPMQRDSLMLNSIDCYVLYPA
jgi:hypothetical protein